MVNMIYMDGQSVLDISSESDQRQLYTWSAINAQLTAYNKYHNISCNINSSNVYNRYMGPLNSRLCILLFTVKCAFVSG